MQRIIGLTGGIATGKTTVSNYLAKNYDLPVFDADIYAREAVQLGSPILGSIASRYGSSILLADGSLNRQQLGNIIFNNPSDRQWLEQQIHPYVRQRLLEAIQKTRTEAIASTDGRTQGSAFEEESLPEGLQGRGQRQSSILSTVVLVVPLLFEANMTDLATEIWVTYCPRELQLERLMARNALSLEQARSRIDSQLAIEEKAARADVILDNSSTRDRLLQQVDISLALAAYDDIADAQARAATADR